MKVAEIAFWANKKYYDACDTLKGNVNPNGVDFNSYAYLVLEKVPEDVDFYSANKKFENPKQRISEFRKYLHFEKPKDLDVLESKEAESVGLIAVCQYLTELGFDCHVDWRVWG